jgi:hypothetical protein
MEETSWKTEKEMGHYDTNTLGDASGLCLVSDFILTISVHCMV